MAAELAVSNVLFHLNAGHDVSSLLSMTSSPTSTQYGPKRSSFDCKQMVLSSLSPKITVHASESVDMLATGFGFHSFLQLLKPFGDKIDHKFQIKDSQLVSRTADDFSVRFCAPLNDIFSVQEAESGSKTPLFKHTSLELLMSEYIQSIDQHLKKAQEEGNTQLTSVLKDSIYLKFFTKMLSSSVMTPFEPINHPVASLIFLSAEDSYDNARQLLIQFKTSKVPDYFLTDDILPLFVVIHDVLNEEQAEKASQLREHIKKQLFVDTFILPLTLDKESHPTALNPPVLTSVDEELQNSHLSFSSAPKLPAADITSIYKLLKEITQKKIIPYMETKISTWDEQVIAPRKSITGRFFNVGKKYFGNKNQNQNEHTTNYNAERGYYGKVANETLTRKLADWSFMLRDYRYAYTTYELAKKDFLSDKAWTYLASTQEMAAFSLLMGATNITSKLKNDTIDPLLDSSNYTYLARCGMKTYALRSILVVAELFCTLRDSWSNGPAAIKWIQKAIDDKLVGKAGKSLLLERIGYIFSLCVSSQARIIMSRKLIKDKPEEEPANSLKLVKNNTATVGLTRNRKAALLQVFAAKNWDPVSHPLQVQLCLAQTKGVYNGLSFAERDGSLYRKLQDTAAKSLAA